MLVFTSFLSQSLPPSPPLSLLSPCLQTATVSESSQNEPTMDSDELTDEVWRTLSGCSDSCMCSMCVCVYNVCVLVKCGYHGCVYVQYV